MNKHAYRGLIILSFVFILSLACPIKAQAVIQLSQDSFEFIGLAHTNDILVDTLTLTNTGEDPLNWTANWNETWLTVLPSSGSAPAIIEIRVSAEALAVGDYIDQISFESSEASNSPYNLTISFDVNCRGRCGDANGDGAAGVVSDAVKIINYVFLASAAPVPLSCGDANGDCLVNVSDVVYMLNFVFLSHSAPSHCCPGGWQDRGGDCCQF